MGHWNGLIICFDFWWNGREGNNLEGHGFLEREKRFGYANEVEMKTLYLNLKTRLECFWCIIFIYIHLHPLITLVKIMFINQIANQWNKHLYSLSVHWSVHGRSIRREEWGTGMHFWYIWSCFVIFYFKNVKIREVPIFSSCMFQ